MNPTLRQFRFVMTFALGFQVLLFACDYYSILPIPKGSADAFAWDLYGSVLKPNYVQAAWWLWYVINVGSLIGLLLLWRSARYFASVALVLGIFETCWSGIRVSAPFASFISQLSFVLYLLGLGIAFFGATVSGRFGELPARTANGT